MNSLRIYLIKRTIFYIFETNQFYAKAMGSQSKNMKNLFNRCYFYRFNGDCFINHRGTQLAGKIACLYCSQL